MLVLTGCEKYNAKPLNTGQILTDVDKRRQVFSVPVEGAASNTNQPLTFVRAAELMRANSPDLKEIDAEYQSKIALAKVKTPLPNPALEAGPNYAFGPDVSNLYRLQPFASIGFSIPTGRRLKRQDELNKANADLAYADAAIRYRELYLQLRENYSELILARRRIELRQQISASANQSSTVSKKLIEAGIASALDVGLIELEQVRLQTEELNARTSLQQAKSQFASLLGISTFNLKLPPEESIGELPTSLPDIAELKQVMLNNHPELARIRAKYEVSERALHLEIARQYPDFRIGPNFMRETGEKKTSLGLTLGIELPFFDRNQQGIAVAKGDREAVRVRYEAAANRALNELERAHQDYVIATEKLKLLKEKVLPKAQTNIDTAKKSLEAGMTDALKFLETERGQRAVQLEALDTELSMRRAWVDLEKAVGYPLQLFPGETAQNQPDAIPSTDNASKSKEIK
ncbi:TolC family protein [Oscillatoria laete-virens NRMC-F 0139]|nr:TolC family protein [Oscillatoria laete-virens]MDL5055712.1 TolC family protein [Oscillatoria laete-virens NRMC-F 0139]